MTGRFTSHELQEFRAGFTDGFLAGLESLAEMAKTALKTAAEVADAPNVATRSILEVVGDSVGSKWNNNPPITNQIIAQEASGLVCAQQQIRVAIRNARQAVPIVRAVGGDLLNFVMSGNGGGTAPYGYSL